MLSTKGYAAQNAATPLGPFSFERRETGPHDVQIEILYCGVCHSDVHQARNEWGNSIYPLVPGHEIIGRVVKTGDHVKRFKVGDIAGVGVFVDSCRECSNCKAGLQQYCEKGMTGTYNGYERDGKTVTYGGYSNQIVTDENYTYHIPDNLSLEGVAPLLCAGITTYSPLRHWKIGKGHKVGIVGLGGLGHMGVKFAASFGAEVTMLSSSASKEKDARRLGAHHFALTSDKGVMQGLRNHFDFILNTVAANHDYNEYLRLLRTDGVMTVVGIPPKPSAVQAFSLLSGRHSLAGSSIGGVPETQEMLNYCGAHNIIADVEVIAMKDINEAYERMIRGDVRYRFVIEMATL